MLGIGRLQASVIKGGGLVSLVASLIFYADTAFLHQIDIVFVAGNRTRRDVGFGLEGEQGWHEVAGYGESGWQVLINPQPLGMQIQLSYPAFVVCAKTLGLLKSSR